MRRFWPLKHLSLKVSQRSLVGLSVVWSSVSGLWSRWFVSAVSRFSHGGSGLLMDCRWSPACLLSVVSCYSLGVLSKCLSVDSWFNFLVVCRFGRYYGGLSVSSGFAYFQNPRHLRPCVGATFKTDESHKQILGKYSVVAWWSLDGLSRLPLVSTGSF